MQFKSFILKFLVFVSLLCICITGCSEKTTTSKDDEVANETGFEDSEYVSAFGDWYLNEYKDEFGDSTGSTFIYTTCDGTFENTATSGSELAVGVYYDSFNQAILIRLLEYQKTKATYLSSSDISMKCKVGEYVFEDTPIGEAPNGELILSESNRYYKDIIAYLEEGEEIRTIIYIDNSKYNFTIKGSGFKEAVEEQEKREEAAGISGTYKNADYAQFQFDSEYLDWFTIKQITPTSGTITKASKSGSATLDYTYDPSSKILKVVPDADWEYRCNYDQFIVTDSVLLVDYGTIEGEIPNEGTFDATTKWLSPINKATKIYEFSKDGTFVRYGTDYEGNAIETQTGSYSITDSFLFEQWPNGSTKVDYILDGKLYTWGQTVYVIDK